MAEIPEGFEGYLLSDTQPEKTIDKAYGLQGIILGTGTPFEFSYPLSLEGILLTFSDRIVFFTVKNNLGKPIEGLEIIAQNVSNTRSGLTDADGKCNLDIDDTATITFKKEKTFQSRAYNRVTEGNLVEYVYQVPVME